MLIEPTQVGKREDLRDIIALIDARKYPISSMAPKGTAPKNTLIEWQVDNYPAPAYAGVLDGADVTAAEYENMAAGRARLGARVQMFRRVPRVSLMAEEISDVAGIGRRGEMARAITKSIEMLKRDMECAFGSDNESQAQAGAAPYKLRGLGKWIQATAQSDLPIPAAYLTPAGNINGVDPTALTEANVNAVLASVWDVTGEDTTYQLICGRSLRSRFSSFTQYQAASTNVMAAVRMFTQSLAEKKITATIDVYEGDFGTIELHPSAWLCNEHADPTAKLERGYLLNMDLLQILYHSPPQRKVLPDNGGGPVEMIWCIATIIVKNPLGLGKFVGVQP